MGMRTRHLPAAVTLLVDMVAATLFVVLGRISHLADGTATTLPVAFTPFLVAVVLAHGIVWWLRRRQITGLTSDVDLATARSIARRRWTTDRIWPAGLLIVVLTWVCALLVRLAMGGGLAVSFALVSLTVLAVLFVGWRVLIAARAARRDDGQSAGR